MIINHTNGVVGWVERVRSAGFRVSWLRISETPDTVVVHVATQESVPTHPAPGSRSGSIVS